MVSREYDGLAGAGGVKDVCRQLAETLAAKGYQVRVVLPRYGFISPSEKGFEPLAIAGTAPGRISGNDVSNCFSVAMHYPEEERREKVAVWHGRLNKVAVYLLEADRFGEKQGIYTYTAAEQQQTSWQEQGKGHYDYFAMNILHQKAALTLMLLLDEAPWVVHCHDGHAALLPAMMREIDGYRHFFRQTGAVVTVHNAGVGYHQEVADLAFAQAVSGLPAGVIQANLLAESFDPFVAAADYAVLNTVSEQYAHELQETVEDVRTGWLGHHLKERQVKLHGITNGINPDSFYPADAEKLGLPASFDILGGEFAGKERCKEDLVGEIAAIRQWEHVEQFGRLAEAVHPPLFTFIGRLTQQKGTGLLLDCIQYFLQTGADSRFLVLGSGEHGVEAELQRLANTAQSSGRLCFLRGFDPALATRIYAAGDFFLVPSLYEPCGLTDYIAQLLGNLPIVHHVGGLVKVLDGRTGFAYTKNEPDALRAAMDRALEVYRRPETLMQMQQQAVKRILEHHTWEQVMDSYIELYQRAEPDRAGEKK